MEANEQNKSFPIDMFSILLKYVDLPDVLKSLSLLNKDTRKAILSENYLIYKHFLRTFNLNDRLKRADIPAKVDIIRLIKDNAIVNKTQT
jgi:hypothetical protein